MKTFYSLFLLIAAISFTACTGASLEEEGANEHSLFESVKQMYGMEMVSLATTGAKDIPSVTLEEMQSVLRSLRANVGVVKTCVTVSSTHTAREQIEEKKIRMSEDYRAATRSGSCLEEFSLQVDLCFTVDYGQLYYRGTDYTSSSYLFSWRGNGLSLSVDKSLGGKAYAFESVSYLYFKVKDEGNCLVRVPVTFAGNYDFETAQGTYSFRV
ncbi:MAG: DUF5033 domain-containing protein [Bacteroides sp.]